MLPSAGTRMARGVLLYSTSIPSPVCGSVFVSYVLKCCRTPCAPLLDYVGPDSARTNSNLWYNYERWIHMWASALCISFTTIPPRLSDPCNFITVLLVTREPEQTTLLFWSAACCVTPHGLHTADRRWPLVRASFKSVFSLNILTACLYTYSLFTYSFFMHQAMCNIIWHLRMFI